MKYTIYHVPKGPKKKIGATDDYPNRCYDQGFKDGEFYVEDQISKVCGTEFAGKVERFWQWYYGLEEPSNTIQYHKSAFVTGAAQRASLVSPNHIAKTGRTGFQTRVANRASVESPNHISKTGRSGFQSGASRRRTPCPECGRVMALTNLGRHRKSRHGIVA